LTVTHAAAPSPLGRFAPDFDSPDFDARHFDARHFDARHFDEQGVIVLDEPDPAEAGAAAGPAITQQLLDAAAAGHAAGLAAGRAEAEAAQEATRRALMAALLARLDDTAAAMGAAVDAAGGALARLVLASLAAGFPALCARHGAAELARFTGEVTALLAAEPRIVIRAHPAMLPVLDDMLAGMEPERRAAILVEPRDSLAPGDARIAWRHGMAVRDTAALRARLDAILAPLGLGPPDAIAEPLAEPAAIPPARPLPTAASVVESAAA